MTSVRRESKFCKYPYIVIYKQPLTSFEHVNKNNTKKAFFSTGTSPASGTTFTIG